MVSVALSVERSDALTGEEDVEAPTLTILDSLGEAFVFEAARAGIRDLDFYLPEGTLCSDLSGELEAPVSCEDDKVRVAGPFVADLMTGSTTPALEGITIPAGVYRRVDVRFDDVREDWNLVTDADPLLGNTFVVAGTILADEQRFRIEIDMNVEARYRNDAGIAVSSEAPVEVVLNLDPSGWFEEVAISQCIADGDFSIVDDVVLIRDSGSNCQDIERDLRGAIRDSGHLLLSSD